MDKCFILARQSSGNDDADESLSISVQLDECRKAAVSKGFNIMGEFKEANTSGRLYPEGYEALAALDITYQSWCRETKKTNQWRHGLGEVLKRLNEVQWIVVYDLTRFFRPLNGSFLGNLLTQTLQQSNVKLFSLKEGIVDFSRFQDSLISSLTSQINSEQLRTQIEKSKAAYKRLRDNGEYYPGLMKIHGYKKTGVKLEVMIDERPAQMVREVFKMFNAAVSVNEIMRYVNNEYKDIFKRPCRRGIITKMLTIPAYCGYQRSSTGELVKSKQLEGKEIVPVEEWMKAHRKLEGRKTHATRPKKRWLPLSIFMYCGHCGGKMKIVGGVTTRRNAYYMCFEHVKTGSSPCSNNLPYSFDTKYGLGINEAVKPLLLAEAMKQMKAAQDDSEAKSEIAKVELEAAEARRKMKKLTDMWMRGVMNEEVYEAAMKELKAKEAEAIKKKTDLELRLKVDVSFFDWTKLMMKFRGEALTNGEYEQLANRMIKKIVVYKDFVEVRTAYGDVSIPRQHLSIYRVCCNYHIRMVKGKAAVYYYYGKASLSPVKSGDDYEKVAMLGDLEVYVQKS